MSEAQRRPHVALATLIASGIICVGGVGVTLSPGPHLVKPLAAVLTASAVVAELLAARYSSQLTVSAAFVAAMLAVGFLGPTPAFVIPLASYVAAWIVARYRWRALLISIAGSSTPAFLVAVAFQAIDPPRSGLGFTLLLAAAAAVTSPSFKKSLRFVPCSSILFLLPFRPDSSPRHLPALFNEYAVSQVR